MDAGKPQAGGAGRVAVGIPFGQVASEARNPVVGARVSGKRRNPFCAMSGPSRPTIRSCGCSRARRDGAASACARGGLGYRVRNGGGIHRRSPRLADIAGRCVRPRGDGRAGRLAEHPPRSEECWSRASTRSHRTLGNGRSDRPDSPSRIRARRAEEPEAGTAERAAGDRPRRRVPPAIGRRLGAPLLPIGRRQRQRRRRHRAGIHVRSRFSDPQCRPRRQPRAGKGSRVVSKGRRTRRSPGEDASSSAPRRTASRCRARRPAGAGYSRKGDHRIGMVGKQLSAESERSAAVSGPRLGPRPGPAGVFASRGIARRAPRGSAD